MKYLTQKIGMVSTLHKCFYYGGIRTLCRISFIQFKANWFYLIIMNEEINGTKNLLKLVILNISILTLISLIIWTFISYSQGESLNFVNIVLIILVAPFVYSLSKDVSSVYKSFK